MCGGGVTQEDTILHESTSGGAFTALCDAFFKIHSDGVVWGVALNQEMQVVHECAMSLEDCSKFRSSKYVQSQIGNAHKQVERALKNNQAVLFTGTPCQVASLKKYLNKDYSKLYTQAIVCHGVPSAKLWIDYLTYLEKKYGHVIDANFRSKRNGWENYCFEAKLESGETIYDNHFLMAFGGNIALRPSCSRCTFKYPNYEADIVLGDFWNMGVIDPRIYNAKGVSMVIGMTEKGKMLFDLAKQKMFGRYFQIADLYKSQKGISSSAPQSPKHDFFLANVKPENFDLFVKRVTKLSIYRKVRRFAAKWYRKALKWIKTNIMR